MSEKKHDHSGHAHGNATGNIGIAFFLNLFFAVVELVGGALTGSIAIMADALHDFGDALTLGLALVLQKLSSRERSDAYTYGYGRLSLLSSLIAGLVLFGGSVVVLTKAIPSLWDESREVHRYGMMGLAVFGLLVNGFAAYRLSRGQTRNEKMLSWHLIEDVLGWAAVLVGSVLMLATGWNWIDPALAICVALFIGFNVVRNLWETIQLFLQRTPEGFNRAAIADALKRVPGVVGVHDVHAWTLDGVNNVLSVHVAVSDEWSSMEQSSLLKQSVRERVAEFGKFHVTIELERVGQCQGGCGE